MFQVLLAWCIIMHIDIIHKCFQKYETFDPCFMWFVPIAFFMPKGTFSSIQIAES
jgi:hypothetical protein